VEFLRFACIFNAFEQCAEAAAIRQSYCYAFVCRTGFAMRDVIAMSNYLPEAHGQPREESIECRYANYFVVGHNAWEFVLEFGQSYMDTQPQVHIRIVTGPFYAKELLRVLAQSIEQYESEFGEID
jgi:hypothetical protein